ncbi:hypothetical protein D3C73_1554580 [compost metagenome]
MDPARQHVQALVHAVRFRFADDTVFIAFDFAFDQLFVVCRFGFAVHHGVVGTFNAPVHQISHFRSHHLVEEGQNLLQLGFILDC